jgi:transposase
MENEKGLVIEGLYGMGFSLRAAAESTGVSHETARTWLRSKNISLRATGTRAISINDIDQLKTQEE